MSLLTRYMDDAYYSWMSSALSCCGAAEARNTRRSLGSNIEKPMTVLHTTQPHLIPAPIAQPQSQQWPRSRSNTISSRMSFRKKSSSITATRRPTISGPLNFTHVDQGLSQTQPRRGFRPLELSIYVDNKISPILPHFDTDIAQPALVHTRSESALSNFTVKRKPLSRASTLALMERSGSEADLVQPLRPRPSHDTFDLQRPAQARLRANTAPAFQLERVVSALQEKDDLDRKLRDIDSVIEERMSVYNLSLSRAGSSMSERDGDSSPVSVYQSEEPLPLSFPSPPSSRPQTAPSRPTVHIPKRLKSFDEAVSTFQQSSTISVSSTHPLSSHQTTLHPQQNQLLYPTPLTPLSPSPISPPTPNQITPPLPLLLNPPPVQHQLGNIITISTIKQQPYPPLRKKKSFSRVSNWLMRDQSHARNISLDSITNMPKPVKARDGFYSVQIPGRNADVAFKVGYGRQDILAGGGDSYGRQSEDSSIVEHGLAAVHDEGDDAETVTTDVSEPSRTRGAFGNRNPTDTEDYESEAEEHTVPTTWTGTPDSSPRERLGRVDREVSFGTGLDRTQTFGEGSAKVLSLWGSERESGAEPLDDGDVHVDVDTVRVSRVGMAF